MDRAASVERVVEIQRMSHAGVQQRGLRTWQVDAGVLPFAQTFVEVKPPTGKLNDCAADDCDPKMMPVSSTAATKPQRSAVFILRFLRFSECSQEWLAESGASFIRSGFNVTHSRKGIGRN